ncbi:hypothetical protein [Streptomyces sp. NPDC006285]|uniref:hypothetical protein n=1 Tax=Streptomyces sp. NPDC006285 TaxID=3364742 RepID=UPI00368BD1E4
MRFATIRHGDTFTGARVEGDRVVLADADNAVDAFLRQDRLRDTGEVDAATAHYTCISPDPAHILCVGLNYRSHIEQLGRPAPPYPTFLAKFPSAPEPPGHRRGRESDPRTNRNQPVEGIGPDRPRPIS